MPDRLTTDPENIVSADRSRALAASVSFLMSVRLRASMSTNLLWFVNT